MSANKPAFRLGEFHMRPAGDFDADTIERHIFNILSEYGLEPDPSGVDKDLRCIEEAFWRSGGAFWVAEASPGRVVATAAMKPVGDEVELQKMYFSPALRGKGLGKELLRWLLNWAQERGFRSVVLDTASVLVEAIRLYESAGFQLVSCDSKIPRCDRTYRLTLRDSA